MNKQSTLRIKIIKSSVQTSWYNGIFINQEFNVIDVQTHCVEIAPPKYFQTEVRYYVKTGDFKIVGQAKGRKKNEFGRYVMRGGQLGQKIRIGKREISSTQNTNIKTYGPRVAQKKSA